MKYYQILYAGRPLTVDDDPIFADYSQMFKFRNSTYMRPNLQIHLTTPESAAGDYTADCENLTTLRKSNSVSINQILNNPK